MRKFEPSFKPKIPDSNDITIVVSSKNGLVCDAKNNIFLSPADLMMAHHQLQEHENLLYIGRVDGKELYAVEWPDFHPSGFTFIHPRSLLDALDSQAKEAIFRSLQLLNWHNSSRHCGCCGKKTHISMQEFVKTCESCDHKMFPQYSPAVIVRVTQGEEILLGLHHHHKEKEIYSTFAGFVEAGETCENAVHREIFEETGIKIKNLKFHSTQSWPFPNSLMIAYTAEYDSGELKINKDELVDARWFHWQKMPNLPIKSSIATQMIEEFVESQRSGHIFVHSILFTSIFLTTFEIKHFRKKPENNNDLSRSVPYRVLSINRKEHLHRRPSFIPKMCLRSALRHIMWRAPIVALASGITAQLMEYHKVKR